MQQIAALDLASLERFQTELVQAGFEPDSDDFTSWAGPIVEPLKRLTKSNSMRLSFRDGWPFQHPRLFVAGLDQKHVNAEGDVCLWAEGSDSGEWLTWQGYLVRIEEWARRAEEGFGPEDFALDAHLAFERIRANAIATINLDDLPLAARVGAAPVISGTWASDGHVLKIVNGVDGDIEGRCYLIGANPVPPRNLGGVRSLLTTSQTRNFDRRRANVAAGAPRLFVIAWHSGIATEVLVLLAEMKAGDLAVEAIQAAPTDVATLKLRAGPDVDALGPAHAVVFGIGAVGSHVALLLAEAGVGRLTLVDRAVLRPGHVVRHAAGAWAIGQPKTQAMDTMIHRRAPWTKVTTKTASTWNPDEIATMAEGINLVVDATGLASFGRMLSLILEPTGVPLISTALYRSGSVGRVRRQGVDGDRPIATRADHPEYRRIPRGAEQSSYEPGCSAPVNNASPIVVAAIAALTSQVAVDLLTERYTFGDEVIDIYRALDEAPFDVVGRVPS